MANCYTALQSVFQLFAGERRLRNVQEISGFARRALFLERILNELLLLHLHNLIEIQRRLAPEILLNIYNAILINAVI